MRLPLLFSVFAVYLCCTRIATAQVTDFEKIFLKEIQAKESGKANFGNFKNINRLSYYPDTIPAWFFSLPPNIGAATYAIGISDPDLPREQALQQALYRARVMAVVFNRAKLQYFRDVYTTEKKVGKHITYRQRFDTYFKLSGSNIADSTHFYIANQHFTRYNEAIILVRYSPDGTGNDQSKQIFTAVGTVLFIEAQIDEAFEPQAEYDLATSVRRIGERPLNSHNLYREKGSRFLYRSDFNGEEQNFPLYYYKYVSSKAPANTAPLTCHNGLWSQYMRELLRVLALTTEQSKVRIKSLGSQQSADNATLYREVAVKTALVGLIGIEFGADSIGFDFRLREIQTK